MPKLFLIPTPLHDQAPCQYQPALTGLRLYVVENAKSARAALKKIVEGIDLRACEFLEANEHTDEKQWQEIFNIVKGKDTGVLSEAGMPCVADPGSRLVLWAHTEGYQVIPLIGPNAMVMALAASGLCGQQFTFHGYLPREFNQRIRVIKALEHESLQFDRTHIFIEAPHHNQSLLDDLIQHCQETTMISIACHLTATDEYVATKSVKQWRMAQVPQIDKIPTVFLIQAFKAPLQKRRS